MTDEYKPDGQTFTYKEASQLGTELVLQAPSPFAPFCCVFEDDGSTGYFYACSNQQQDQHDPIMDALHIYNIDPDIKGHQATITIRWSNDGLKSGLFVNDVCHGVFDFEAYKGYCRSELPPPLPDKPFSEQSHAWSDDCLDFFS